MNQSRQKSLRAVGKVQYGRSEQIRQDQSILEQMRGDQGQIGVDPCEVEQCRVENTAQLSIKWNEDCGVKQNRVVGVEQEGRPLTLETPLNSFND